MDNATRTHVILDGLQDLRDGQKLSVKWAQAGFRNGVDVAGQTAWLAGESSDSSKPDLDSTLTEEDMQRAASLARGYGLWIRDRVGNTFRPNNDLAELRQRMIYEYKSRFVTALVFGLPAMGLHYAGPVLAGGIEGPGGAKWMLYPWLFEMVLVGWVCLAAGWPVLCQGLTSLMHGRWTPDLLTTVLVLVAWAPSALGVLSMVWGDQPWFISSLGVGGPSFHAALLAITLAVLQRWWMYRCAEKLSGRSHNMIPRLDRLILFWLMLVVAVMVWGSWWQGMAFGLLLPPLISSGAINPNCAGRSAVLPVFGFAALFLIGPTALNMPLEGVEIETAVGFCLVMTLYFFSGWRKLEVMADEDKTLGDATHLGGI